MCIIESDSESDMNEIIIKVDNVTFAYGGKEIFSGLSFKAQRGDFLCITGINGTGKTTLLKLLLKSLKPSKGEILIDYNNNKIAYVPQKAVSFNQAFPATVEEIVSLGAYPVKDRTEVLKKVDWALENVKLSDCKKNLVGRLSGGQQQRVFIAKALAGSPDILILDEPTTGIDNDSLGDICCLIADINTNLNITVLMVTHDVSSIINHANKVLHFGYNNISLLTSDEFRKNIFH